jgi:hypothetical protein
MKSMKESTKRRLKAYTAVATGALVVASQAEAAVQYSGLQNLTVDAFNTPVDVDLNGDGVVDFRFYFFYSYYYGYIINTLAINPFTLGDSWIDTTANGDPARLPTSYPIRATLVNPSFSWDYESRDILALYSNKYGSTDGNFVGQRGYIGVRFISAQCNSGNYHYGWIQFEGAADASSGTIIDWAYEDQCNTPILAGDRGQPTAVPTLEQWGTLAMAAFLAGAAAMRLRKRQQEEFK